MITDTHGDRVFEVNQQGEIVWSVNVEFPYEAERLGTGDESAVGPSAAKAGLPSRSESDDRATEQSGSSPGRESDDGGVLAQSFEAGREVLERVEEAVPERVMNGVLFMLPG